MGQSMMNGRPPSPPRRSMGGPPPPLSHEHSSRDPYERNSRDPYGHSGHSGHNGHSGHASHASHASHAPYGASQQSPHVQNTSPHHPFAQMLHPQRSASSSSSFANVALNTNNVTREDFTLRGPSSNNPPRPNEPRNGSSASSNPSLRNLLS